MENKFKLIKKFFTFFFLKINIPKTIYFNLKSLPLEQALRFPIFIYKNVRIKTAKGRIILKGEATKTGMIRIGSRVAYMGGYQGTTFWIEGRIIFHGLANIGYGSMIHVWETGCLSIGSYFGVSASSTIRCAKNISIGNGCMFSWDIVFMDTDSHNIYDDNHKAMNPPESIVVGNNVWIGCRCLILKGAVIGHGSVIGANTTVTKKLEKENCVYAGNPPRCIKERIQWD
jgi:acetyltransferase-like isoleucine patch superfamily enzyme